MWRQGSQVSMRMARGSVSLLSSHGRGNPSSRRVEDFVTPWTIAYQAPRSMGFSRPGSSVHGIFQARILAAAAAAKSLQSCPTLWDPIDGSPPGSTVSRILQARTLEWLAEAHGQKSLVGYSP